MNEELDEIRERLIQAESKIAALETQIKLLQEMVNRLTKPKFPDLRWRKH